MLRTWQRFGTNMVLTLGMAVTTVASSSAQNTGQPSEQDDPMAKQAEGIQPTTPTRDPNALLQQMEEQLRQMTRTANALARVEKDLSDTQRRRDMELLTLEAKVTDIEKQLKALRDNLELLTRRMDSTSQSLKPTRKVDPTKGEISLRNDWISEVTILVNNTAYRLAPGDTRVVLIEPGTFTYQVIPGDNQVRERTVGAGGSYEIRAYVQENTSLSVPTTSRFLLINPE